MQNLINSLFLESKIFGQLYKRSPMIAPCNCHKNQALDQESQIVSH